MIFIIWFVFILITWIVGSRFDTKLGDYAIEPVEKNLTGGEVARQLLADHMISKVKIVCGEASADDYFDPKTETLTLGKEVYEGKRMTHVAIAAQESVHAVQYYADSQALKLRTAIIPSQDKWIKSINALFATLVIANMVIRYLSGVWVLPWTPLIIVILISYVFFMIPYFRTLPLERDASKSAMKWLMEKGIITADEEQIMRRALKWVSLRYIVPVFSANNAQAAQLLDFLAKKRD